VEMKLDDIHSVEDITSVPSSHNIVGSRHNNFERVSYVVDNQVSDIVAFVEEVEFVIIFIHLITFTRSRARLWGDVYW
jgi:hypothetical protein